MDRYEKGISAYKATRKGAQKGSREDEERLSADKPAGGKLADSKPLPGKPAAGKTRAGKPGAAKPSALPSDRPSIEGFVKSTHTEGGFRKAAKFLLLMGKEEAAKVLTHFSDEEIEGITREIAQIKKIDGEEATKILTDFGFIKETGPVLRGGVDTVRGMLTQAFGNDKAEEYVGKLGYFKGNLKPFAFLHDLDFAQILLLFKNEPDTVISVILPHLEPALASKILKTLPAEIQKMVVKRIAGMRKIDSGILATMEGTLKEKIRKQGKVVTNELDGKKALADILKHMDFQEEDSILKSLAEDSPDLSKDIREKLFTMDIVFHLGDKDLQKVLRDYDETQIALLIKDKTETVRAHLLRNVSERRRTLILDEYDHLGTVRKKDVQSAARDFLSRLTALAEEGTITIKRERETYV